ncbi:MAG: hypothetical protein VKK97_08730, partial [Synechococcaceae cyanobacterium]|nr:hypothetical protein [Synechococcaceae cyanobacterium]
MTSSSPDSAADLVRLEPESLARWHQLVSAGFEQNNPSQVHHGITGSLILDCAHPVTIYQIKLAFQKLPLESYWQYLILRTLQTYGQPILHDLLPIWSDLRLLDQPTPPSWPVQQASRPPALDGLLLRRDLEEVVAVLSTYSLTNGNDTDPCWFPSLLESTLAAEAFGPGKIHTLTVSAHKCLVSLLVKYKVSLRCKVFVDVEGTDVLRIFLEQLKPHCIPVNEATLRWVCLCLEILDPNQKNDYYCAFLLAACFCALVSGDTPESRSTLLTRAVGDDISQFNATPLLRRFFLRAAPPSLARQFLARTTKSDPEHSTATDAYSKTKTTAKYIAESEMAFHLSSFEPPTTSAEAADFKAIYPCLQNIDVSELREARSHYISGSAFAVSIFGQLRHSSFRALRNSLQFCGSEAERRCPFVSVSSWSQ